MLLEDERLLGARTMNCELTVMLIMKYRCWAHGTEGITTLISQAIQFMLSAEVPLGYAAKNDSLPVGKGKKKQQQKQTNKKPQTAFIKDKTRQCPARPWRPRPGGGGGARQNASNSSDRSRLSAYSSSVGEYFGDADPVPLPCSCQ